MSREVSIDGMSWKASAEEKVRTILLHTLNKRLIGMCFLTLFVSAKLFSCPLMLGDLFIR